MVTATVSQSTANTAAATWPDVDRRRSADLEAPPDSRPVTDAPPPQVQHELPRRTIVRWSSIAFGVILASLLVVGGLWVATGGRYYIVTTPSMSPALPVGSLVLTKTFTQADVQKGTIIAFVPPTGKYRMFTHRVIGVDPAGYLTKGDASMNADPWGVVPFANVRGIVVSVLPGVGWLVRALPWLLLGLLIAIGLAAFVPWRWGVFMPIVAMVIVLSVPLLILKPLVRGELVQTKQTNDAVVARVVNTGLLPLKFTATGIDGVHVAPGHWTDLQLPVPKVTGKYGIDANAMHRRPCPGLLTREVSMGFGAVGPRLNNGVPDAGTCHARSSARTCLLRRAGTISAILGCWV